MSGIYLACLAVIMAVASITVSKLVIFRSLSLTWHFVGNAPSLTTTLIPMVLNFAPWNQDS